MKEIERQLGLSNTEWDLKTRVKILLLRYQTFKEVTAEHGTHWNRPEKCVTAEDDVWMKIFEKIDYAQAYYYEREPVSNELAMLFGMEDVKLEPSPTVILISDTTVNLVSGEGEEEVNSPATFVANKVKRKLFVDEGGASDPESTNQPPIRRITTGSDGIVVNSLSNNHNDAKNKAQLKPDGTPQAASPITTSCASSSPVAWWRRPRCVNSMAIAEVRAGQGI